MSGATNKSGPQPQAADDSPKVWVFLTNGIMTSTGKAGPGPFELPAAEANALLAARLAVPGGQPPLSFLGAF